MRFLLKLLTPIIILILVSLSLSLLEERKVFDTRTLVQIDPFPRTEQLIKEEKYAEAHEHLLYFIEYDYVKQNPKAKELLKTIEEKRASYTYKRDKFFEGVVTGKSDEDIGKASAIASDFLIIGDIRDLSIEGSHYVQDEKVDKVMVALSSLGIIATASTIYTLGATAPLKSSLSLLKYGKRINKLPSWLGKELIKQAKISKNTNSINNIKTLMKPINNLYEKIGLANTLNLIKKSKSFTALTNIVQLSTRFGKKTNILIQTTGAKSIKEIKSMVNVKNSSILYASTYGSKGITALKRMGESRFLKRTKWTANLTKTGYKGNLDSLFTKLLNTIPSAILFGMAFLGLFYFVFKFSFLVRKVF